MKRKFFYFYWYQKKGDNPMRGFTLVEYVIGTAMTVLIALFVTSSVLVGLRSFRDTRDKLEVNQNVRIALDRIVRDLRQAQEVVTDTSIATDSILFQDGHLDPTWPPTQTVQYLKYELEGNDLHRKRIVYSFDFGASPVEYVYWDELDGSGNQPSAQIIEDKVVAQKITKLTFFGTSAIQATLFLNEGTASTSMYSIVYPRN